MNKFSQREFCFCFVFINSANTHTVKENFLSEKKSKRKLYKMKKENFQRKIFL